MRPKWQAAVAPAACIAARCALHRIRPRRYTSTLGCASWLLSRLSHVLHACRASRVARLLIKTYEPVRYAIQPNGMASRRSTCITRGAPSCISPNNVGCEAHPLGTTRCLFNIFFSATGPCDLDKIGHVARHLIDLGTVELFDIP